MINTDNIEKAKTLIKKETKPIIVKAQNDIFNRKILEYGKFDSLLSIELSSDRDSLRNIDSGFNEVLAKIAKKNGISLGIDLEEIKNLDFDKKSHIITKLIQNIKLCRKYKVPLRLFNYKDKKNAFSFLISLGASTNQAKESLSF